MNLGAVDTQVKLLSRVWLCDPVDCSLPGSSIHGIFQAFVLEWAAISFSRGSSQSRDWTRVSCIVDRRFTVWATREARWHPKSPPKGQYEPRLIVTINKNLKMEIE